jgi:hypothetical protein
MIRLFDIQDGKLTPTEHCYTLKFLKDIMDSYPEQHLKIYTYLFYMTCHNPDLNPFFHFKDEEKEEVILKEINADFSTEDDLIVKGLESSRQMYETEISRAYYGIKKALDNIARYMAYTPITDGRDGNVTQIGRIAKDFDAIRQSYKGVYKDLMEEQQTKTRGGAGLAYDQL